MKVKDLVEQLQTFPQELEVELLLDDDKSQPAEFGEMAIDGGELVISISTNDEGLSVSSSDEEE